MTSYCFQSRCECEHVEHVGVREEMGMRRAVWVNGQVDTKIFAEVCSCKPYELKGRMSF